MDANRLTSFNNSGRIWWYLGWTFTLHRVHGWPPDPIHHWWHWFHGEMCFEFHMTPLQRSSSKQTHLQAGHRLSSSTGCSSCSPRPNLCSHVQLLGGPRKLLLLRGHSRRKQWGEGESSGERSPPQGEGVRKGEKRELDAFTRQQPSAGQPGMSTGCREGLLWEFKWNFSASRMAVTKEVKAVDEAGPGMFCHWGERSLEAKYLTSQEVRFSRI